MSTPGTPAAATAAPIPVAREVDEDWAGVTLDLTGQVDMLRLLAQAVCDAGMLTEFAVLGRNNRDARCTLAQTALLDRQAVRDALTLTLHADTATALADRLTEAGTDLACCHCQHRAVMEGSSYCPQCQVGVDALDAARAS